MNPILLAVLIVSVIGLIAGLGLAVASIVMAVPVDKKAEPAKAKKPGTLTECGGTCEYSPTVVIHGIGQSKTCNESDDRNDQNR